MSLLRWCPLSLALSIGLATAAGAQSLDDVLIATYRNNPQIEADRARQRATDEDVARALGGWRPTATLTYEHGRGHDIFQYDRPTSYGHVLDAYSNHEYRTPDLLLLQIQQMIYDGGRVSADVLHSKLAVEAGLAQMVSVEQSVLGTAVQAYYDLYRDQQILDLQRQNVEWLQEQAKAAHARFAVKDVTQTDVAQAEARLARGIADMTAAEGTLIASRSAFQTVTGIVPGVLQSAPPAPLHLLPAGKDEALALGETAPDLRSAILQEKAAEAEVDYVAGQLMPEVSLRATARKYNESDQANIRNTDQQVVLSVTVPLYEGGVYAARTRGAKQTVGQRRLDIDNARRKMTDQVNRSWQQLITARTSIKALTEQVRAAEVARKSIQAEVRAGSRTVLDQLNAEQELVDARVALLRSQHDEVVAVYSVLLSVGHLTAAQLGLAVELYDPAIHYESVRSQWFGTGINEKYPEMPKDEKDD